jgi:phosphate transport system protein
MATGPVVWDMLELGDPTRTRWISRSLNWVSFLPMPTMEAQVRKLFAEVREALARATYALLNADVELAQCVVDGDQEIDDLTSEVELMVWSQMDTEDLDSEHVRQLVGVLLILPELERSADLAEHIAQRALTHTGPEMTPTGRGIVQRMSEVAAEMWQAVGAAYNEKNAASLDLHEEDEELDILHDRLTKEIANADMPTSVAAQVTLISRFYERIGDHAVNLSRRLEALQS